MKKYNISTFLFYAGFIVCLSLTILSLRNLYQFNENRKLVSLLRKQGIVNVDAQNTIHTELEGRYIYVTGCMNAVSNVRKRVFDNNHNCVGEITRQCLWLKYEEERYHRRRRSYSWKVDYSEVIHAPKIMIDNLEVAGSIVETPIPNWERIYQKRFGGDYRVSISEVASLNVSCIAKIKEGRMQEINEYVPMIVQTRSNITIDSLLQDYEDAPLNKAITYMAFVLVFCGVWWMLRRKQSHLVSSVGSIPREMTGYIKSLNNKRRLYLGIIILCVFVADYWLLSQVNLKISIMWALLLALMVCSLPIIILHLFFQKTYRKQYKNTIIISLARTKSSSLEFKGNSDFNKEEMKRLGILGNLQDAQGFFKRYPKYEVKTEDCFWCQDPQCYFNFFECTVNRTDKYGRRTETNTLLHCLCLKMPCNIDSSIEMLVDNSRMTYSTSLPTLNGIYGIDDFVWKGIPQRDCEDLLQATAFTEKINKISNCIKNGFGQKGFLLLIKDSILYVLIEAQKNHFDPCLIDSLSLDTVAEDYRSISTMCDIAALCNGITRTNRNNIVVEVSDDLIEF